VKSLFEFLLDALNSQVDYTLYTGIFLGLTVQFLWMWHVDYRLVHSIYASTDVHIQVKSTLLQMERQRHSNTRLLWIVTFIRRKESPGDEPDPSISPTISY
jgi:hypothetical protein